MFHYLTRSSLRWGISLWLLGTAILHGAAKPEQAALKFEPVGGVFTNPVSLRIVSSIPGTIHVTLDGTEPTEQSEVYSAPLLITNTALVRALSIGTGSNRVSLLASQTYVLTDDDLRGFSSNLPLVLINTFGQEIEHDAKSAAAIRFIKADASGRVSLAGAAEFDGRALINVRGRASLRYPKRSFSVRPIDEQDDHSKVSLFGLASDSDWILYAPYPDKTFLRDVLAYKLSNEMGRYASATRFLEVFVNETIGRLSKSSYMG